MLRRTLSVLEEYSVFLILGAIGSLIWANSDTESYHHLVEWKMFEAIFPHSFVNLHFFVNGVLMAFFFALAAKEVWEALLPGGSLSCIRRAAMPLVATAGGMTGPALLFISGAIIFDAHHLMRGWAIPCATDIAFSYLIARAVFGAGHSAIPFLLLLAIADDAGGLIILATCYPSGEIHPLPFVLFVGGGMIIAAIFRAMRIQSWMCYIFIAGALSWTGFFIGGFEPALGLTPVIPFLPHAKSDLGIFMQKELQRKDTLNQMEHDLKLPVEMILGLFGLANAGVVFGNFGTATILVSVSLILGKPLGIVLFSLLGKWILRLDFPKGMGFRELFVVGIAAGIGFTVALFVATVAFRPGMHGLSQADLDAAKMGALLSFSAFLITFVSAKICRIQKIPSPHSSPLSERS